jgi:hypothetical protein
MPSSAVADGVTDGSRRLPDNDPDGGKEGSLDADSEGVVIGVGIVPDEDVVIGTEC